MNTYTRNMQNSNPAPALSAEKKQQPENSFFRMIFLLGCICLIFFCAIALRIFLTTRIERMNKQVSRINAQIREYEYQCYHLRNKKASLTSLSYVSGKVRQYSLGLRPADYRQVRTVALLPEGGIRSYSGTPSGYTRDYSAAANHRKEIRYARNHQTHSLRNNH